MCVATGRSSPRRALGVVRARLDELAADRGETEVLQYGKMKWTVGETKKYADGFASGLGELGTQAGDAVASLIAADAPESHCAQIAAASAGFVYVAIDPALGPDAARLPRPRSRAHPRRRARARVDRSGKLLKPNRAARPQVRAALTETGAKVLIHSGSDADVALVSDVVPEFAEHEARTAAAFHSPVAPDLKYFVTTGLDMQQASANYQHLLAVDGPKPTAAVPNDALLAVSYGAAGVEKLTHKEVIEKNAFPALTAVLNAEHTIF